MADIELLDDHYTEGIALYMEKDHNIYKGIGVNRALAFNRERRRHNYPVTWNVVIPCSNYGDYLEEAIRSVLQNMADYVITIVDDGSEDNSPVIAKRYSDMYQFINFIPLEKSKGVGFARNTGIGSIESVFVILLDADDRIGPTYLSDAERLLRSGYDIANPDAILFGDFNSRWEVPDKVSLEMLLQKNRVHTCAAFRRSYWAQVGGIDESLTYWQDYDFWIRLAEAGARIARLHGDHFYYRKHGNSKTNRSAEIRQILHQQILKKHKHLYT
jgi:glycosyltransferase involved in cell wall biosynthesis